MAMRYLGDGIYEDAEGRRYEWDSSDAQPDPCASCEEEFADGEDGICSFCREEEAVAATYARPAGVGKPTRAEMQARLEAWIAEDPARGRASEEARARLAELRQRKGAAA